MPDWLTWEFGKGAALTGVIVCLALWLWKVAWPILKSRRALDGANKVKPINFKPTKITFALLALGMLFFHSYFGMSPNGSGQRYTGFWGGFLASMWQDIIFFGVLGLVVYVTQTQDYFRSLRLPERLNVLVNGKDLSDGEIRFLEDVIARNFFRGLSQSTHVSIKKVDVNAGYYKVQFDREFTIASYLQDAPTIYVPKFVATPDPGMPSGKLIYMKMQKNGRYQDLAKNVIVPAQGIRQYFAEERIAPNDKRTFRMRAEACIPIDQPYSMACVHPWDRGVLKVSSSTGQDVNIRVCQGGTPKDMGIPKCIMDAEDPEEVWSDENLVVDHKVSIFIDV